MKGRVVSYPQTYGRGASTKVSQKGEYPVISTSTRSFRVGSIIYINYNNNIVLRLSIHLSFHSKDTFDPSLSLSITTIGRTFPGKCKMSPENVCEKVNWGVVETCYPY